ncbi:MAG: hypothetical protein Q9217_006117 [Psora testacea]
MRAELWQPIATELNIPWRTAEAMHWNLGEREIARRANTVPFSIVSGANTAGPQGEGNGRIAQSNRMHVLADVAAKEEWLRSPEKAKEDAENGEPSHTECQNASE